MSARREKRLRKLENDVAYLGGQLQLMREQLLDAKDVFAKPVHIVYSPKEKDGKTTTSLLGRLLNRFEVWKFRRKYIRPDTNIEGAVEALKEHPPRPFS